MSEGFTLLELLLALALLSALVLGLGGWLTAVAQVDAATEDLEWQVAAVRVLACIELDLRTGDHLLEGVPIEATDEGVRILGRRGNWIDYAFDATTGQLRRGEDPQVLLGSTAEFQTEIEHDRRTVTVTLVSVAGTQVRSSARW